MLANRRYQKIIFEAASPWLVIYSQQISTFMTWTSDIASLVLKLALTLTMIWVWHGIGYGGDDTIGDGELEPDLILGPGWCRQPELISEPCVALSSSCLIWNVYFEVRTRQLSRCTMAFMDCERNQLLLSNLNIAETAFWVWGKLLNHWLFNFQSLALSARNYFLKWWDLGRSWITMNQGSWWSSAGFWYSLVSIR